MYNRPTEDDAASGRLGEGYPRRYNRRGRTHPAFVLAVIAAILAFGGWVIYRSDTPNQDEVHTAADNAAYELERTPVKGIGLNIFDIQQALSKGNPPGYRGITIADGLRVDDAGRVDDTDFYEITNRKGGSAVCLAVTLHVSVFDPGPSFPSTSVEDGRCRLPSPSPSVSPSPSDPAAAATSSATAAASASVPAAPSAAAAAAASVPAAPSAATAASVPEVASVPAAAWVPEAAAVPAAAWVPEAAAVPAAGSAATGAAAVVGASG